MTSRRLMLLATAFLVMHVAAQQKIVVSGVGAHPVSRNVSSMWLAGPDHRPALMVYFYGPDNWHDTSWKIASEFGKSSLCWAELRSEKITLRIALDAGTGVVGVQSGTFNIAENNTFVVLHAGETGVPQKIVPLGIYDIPPSQNEPASILLLRTNPELVKRIEKEAANHK